MQLASSFSSTFARLPEPSLHNLAPDEDLLLIALNNHVVTSETIKILPCDFSTAYNCLQNTFFARTQKRKLLTKLRIFAFNLIPYRIQQCIHLTAFQNPQKTNFQEMKTLKIHCGRTKLQVPEDDCIWQKPAFFSAL